MSAYYSSNSNNNNSSSIKQQASSLSNSSSSSTTTSGSTSAAAAATTTTVPVVAEKPLPRVASYFRKSLSYFRQIEQEHPHSASISTSTSTSPPLPSLTPPHSHLNPHPHHPPLHPPPHPPLHSSESVLLHTTSNTHPSSLSSVTAVSCSTSNSSVDTTDRPIHLSDTNTASSTHEKGLSSREIVLLELQADEDYDNDAAIKLNNIVTGSPTETFSKEGSSRKRALFVTIGEPKHDSLETASSKSTPRVTPTSALRKSNRSMKETKVVSFHLGNTYDDIPGGVSALLSTNDEISNASSPRRASIDSEFGLSKVLDSSHSENSRPSVIRHYPGRSDSVKTSTSSVASGGNLFVVSYDSVESTATKRKKLKQQISLKNITHSTSIHTISSPRSHGGVHAKKIYKGVFEKRRAHETLLPSERHNFFVPDITSADSPSKKFTYEYDYVMVFPLVPTQDQGQSTDAKFIMHTMLRAGLELFPYLSFQSDALFVLIRCPTEVLKSIAERTSAKLLTDPKVLETLLAKGNPEKRIAPMKIKHEPKITPIEPCQHVYLRYQKENNPFLYKNLSAEDGPFTKLIRLKLIHSLLTAPKRLGGCNLQITSLVHQRKLLSIFPLHDPDECHSILLKCLDWKTLPWTTPNEELKAYLGEKISLFNAFLGHFSWWLLPLVVIGTGCQLAVMITGNYSHPVLPIYSAIIIVWSIFMLANWKREQTNIALRWGMVDFVDQQFERPEFYGELHSNSFIDGREMLYFSRKDFRRRIARSLVTVLSMVLLVLGVISAIYVLKFTLRSNLGFFVSGIASILNVTQIMLFNLVYQNLAVRLTDQENHRTDTEYENALILKVFVFQFINSYASLFFLAFVAQALPRPTGLSNSGQERNYVGQCGDTTCMRPLAINLGVIIGSRTVFKNFMDLIIPYAKCLHSFYKYSGGTMQTSNLSPPELDYMLMEYDPILESVRKYADIAVQFGYTVLFAAALPLAPMMTLFYNYVKVKSQAWKLLMLYKRPIPGGAQGIESWQLIFTIISIIAVVTNAGIICFTMTSLNIFPQSVRVWVFVCFQWVMLLVQYLTSIMIPESSEYANIQSARIDAISQKIVDKFEDDDFDSFAVDYTSDDDTSTANIVEKIESSSASGRLVHDKLRDSSFSSIPEIDLESQLSSENVGMLINNEQEHNKGMLKRADNFFLYERANRPTWWKQISRGFALHKNEEHLVTNPYKKKKKLYRTRVLNPTNDALALSALDIFEYPKTESMSAWNPPLTQEKVGADSQLDIFQLDI